MSMQAPDKDLENRKPIWFTFQWLFCDIDPVDYYNQIIKVCSASGYKIEELEEILFNEVLPALRANLTGVAGVWTGFDDDWLIERVLERHRFNKRRPQFFRKYTQTHWDILKPRIEKAKELS